MAKKRNSPESIIDVSFLYRENPSDINEHKEKLLQMKNTLKQLSESRNEEHLGHIVDKHIENLEQKIQQEEEKIAAEAGE